MTDLPSNVQPDDDVHPADGGASTDLAPTDLATTDLASTDPASVGLSIAFTREELVVLSELSQLRLPLLGDRPLGGIDSGVRDVLVGSARRSLLARGIATRSDDGVHVARAAIGLLEIVAAGSLRVVLDESDGTGALVSRRLWFAVPYAAVEVWVDEDENYRFLPFATVDLLARVLQRSGIVDAADAAGAEISLPYGAWAGARSASHAQRPLEARQALLDVGLEGPPADAIVAVLEGARRRVGVQIAHHPSPATTAGGEVAWVDAADAGVWSVPTLDQPFVSVDVRADGWFGAAPGDPTLGDPDPDLAPVPVTLTPVARQAIADVLLSFLPAD